MSARKVRASSSRPCGYCGEPTSEADRSGTPAHKDCVKRVLATVAEEARPSRDSLDVTQRVRDQAAEAARQLHDAGEQDARLLAAAARLRWPR